MLPPGLPEFENHRQDGYDNNRDDHQFEMLLNEFDASKEYAAHNADENPRNAADDVEEPKAQEVHLANAGNKWCESAHDGDKARQDDRFSAVLFVKFLGFD